MNDVIEVAKKIVKKVRGCLTIGSSNSAEDITRTSNYVIESIAAVRKEYSYVKCNNTFVKKYRSKPHHTNETICYAELAAAALSNRTGNCIEMAALAAFFMLEHDTSSIQLSIVGLRDPLDHAFLIITDTVTSQKVICDPWLNIAYEIKDDASAMQYMKEYLLKKMNGMSTCNEASHKLKKYTALKHAILKNTQTPEYEPVLEIDSAHKKQAFLAATHNAYQQLINATNLKYAKNIHCERFKSCLDTISLFRRKKVTFGDVTIIPDKNKQPTDPNHKRVTFGGVTIIPHS